MYNCLTENKDGAIRSNVNSFSKMQSEGVQDELLLSQLQVEVRFFPKKFGEFLRWSTHT